MSEPQSHFCVRNVIDLMSPGLEQETVHCARHVTRDAPAGLRSPWMPGVKFDVGQEARVTLQAHLVGLVRESERLRIGSCVRRVGVVTMPAGHLSLLKAGGPLQGLYDESGFAKSSVLIEGLA